MGRAMSADRHLASTNSQSPQLSTQPSARGRLWSWLSTSLIVAGLLLLGVGGVMIYRDSVILAEPPPAVGVVEPPPASMEGSPLPVLADSQPYPGVDEPPSPASLGENPLPVLVEPLSSVDSVEPASPPSLEENPLPVVADGELPGVAVDDAPLALISPPVSNASSDVFGSDTAKADQGLEPEAGQDVPSGPPPASSPNSVSPAKSPPTRIVAPAINLDSEVIPVGWKQIIERGTITSVWEVPEYAAGWHQNSALPGGGGNIVLSGHHNVKGEVFRYIVDLNPGDMVTLYADDRPYTYTVESRFVVRDKGEPEEKRRENAQWIGPFPDERLTLVTCWPYTNNTHRVIVVAKPAE
jgi:LPXTG-site transpeptidase (sortase) family protein